MRLLLVTVIAALTCGCTAKADRELPFYTSADFTPVWHRSESRVANFALTTQAGSTLTGKDLRGRIQVASFVFTRCSVICPLLVERLQAVQSAARDWDDVQMLSFSVDPDRDTADMLATYARDRRIDGRRWALLTGDRTQIVRLARTFYFADDGRLAGTENDFLHTEKVLLVDQEGRLRGIYNGTLKVDVSRLISDIAVLRASPG
jgi:protein SCO1